MLVGNALGLDWECFGIALGLLWEGENPCYDAIPFIFYL